MNRMRFITLIMLSALAVSSEYVNTMPQQSIFNNNALESEVESLVEKDLQQYGYSPMGVANNSANSNNQSAMFAPITQQPSQNNQVPAFTNQQAQTNPWAANQQAAGTNGWANNQQAPNPAWGQSTSIQQNQQPSAQAHPWINNQQAPNTNPAWGQSAPIHQNQQPAASTNQSQQPLSSLAAEIEEMYSQIQSAQNQTFDATTYANFGSALVDIFNQSVQVSSFMQQLLNAAATTPLLNADQQHYVTNTMLPDFNSVDEATHSIAGQNEANASASTAPATAAAVVNSVKKAGGKHKKKKNHKNHKASPIATTTEAAPTTLTSPAAHTAKVKKSHKKGSHKKKKHTVATHK